MKIISLFSGCGGLDLGFEQVGFEIIWANDFLKACTKTYKRNHPNTTFDTRSIVKVPSKEIPTADGMIGGPPCQSWSCGGSNKGIADKRGKVFLEYLRIVRDRNPKFFVIENVEGILRSTHRETLNKILAKLTKLGDYGGYIIKYQLLNARDYGVPQDRKRVFFVGFRKDYAEAAKKFEFPQPLEERVTLRDAIYHLKGKAKPHTEIENNKYDHAYLESEWSPQFMTRNRVRTWDESAFTVPASGRHVTMHPQAPVMEKINADKFEFVKGQEKLYRRFTIRECACIQTFPEDFEFLVDNVNQGYKLIGNAVPVKLANHIAKSVLKAFE